MKKKIHIHSMLKIWKLLNRGYHYNSEIYFNEFWGIKIKQKFQNIKILVVAPFRIFYGLKKCFILPFFYLLTDLRKLWTKNFGFISSFTVQQKNNKFDQKKPICTRFMIVVHKPHITVSTDMLSFTRKLYILTWGIRAHQDNHLELLYDKIAL